MSQPADYYLGDHDVGELSFAVGYTPDAGGGYYWQMANESKINGLFPTSEGAYLAAIGE